VIWLSRPWRGGAGLPVLFWRGLGTLAGPRYEASVSRVAEKAWLIGPVCVEDGTSAREVKEPCRGSCRGNSKQSFGRLERWPLFSGEAEPCPVDGHRGHVRRDDDDQRGVSRPQAIRKETSFQEDALDEAAEAPHFRLEGEPRQK
jgi:hypothetical protein